MNDRIADGIVLTAAQGRGGPGSETDTMNGCVGVGETRRNSAPELADQWQRPGGPQSQGALPLSLPKQVQRLTQPPSQPKPTEFEPNPETGACPHSLHACITALEHILCTVPAALNCAQLRMLLVEVHCKGSEPHSMIEANGALQSLQPGCNGAGLQDARTLFEFNPCESHAFARLWLAAQC